MSKPGLSMAVSNSWTRDTRRGRALAQGLRSALTWFTSHIPGSKLRNTKAHFPLRRNTGNKHRAACSCRVGTFSSNQFDCTGHPLFK